MQITTAEQLERMTPAERDQHFEESVVTDLGALPPGAVDDLRARFAPLLATTDPSTRRAS